MKINEMLFKNESYSNNKKDYSTDNFASWLNNPLKNSTGDAFYWQHQHELQPSNLDFDKLCQKQLMNHHVLLNDTLTQYPLKQSSEKAIYMPRPNKAYLADVHVPVITKAPLSHTVKQFLKSLEQKINACQLYNRVTFSWENISDALKTSYFSSYLEGQFKQHHCFVDEDQMELTLNLHGMSPREQKELAHTIKLFFKSKKLLLSNLLINGVQI